MSRHYVYNLSDDFSGIKDISIPINGKAKALRLEISYNRRGDFWKVSIFDVSSSEYLVKNMPLVWAVRAEDGAIYSVNKQLKHLGFGQMYFSKASEENRIDRIVFKTRMSKDFRLIWGVDE